MEVKINNGNEMIDATIEMVDGVMVVSPKNVYVPKDGDVVVNGRFIFIYNDCMTAEAYYYCGMSLTTSKILFPDGGHFGYVNHLRPASEKEKKLMFDKIDEEGFTWDADKKELVKKKWMPKFNEEYFIPSFTIADKFSPCTIIYSNDNIEDDYISRGWAFPNEEKCQQFCNRLNDAINSIKP